MNGWRLAGKSLLVLLFLLMPALPASAGSVQEYLAKGYALWTAGDKAGALAYLNEAIKLNPTHPGGYMLRADLQTSQGRLDAAVKDLQLAHDLYLKQGDSQSAEKMQARKRRLESQIAAASQAKAAARAAHDDTRKSAAARQLSSGSGSVPISSNLSAQPK